MKTLHIVLCGLSETKHTIRGKVRKCVFWVNQSKVNLVQQKYYHNVVK